jgi:D-glycero-alpha-D-manno-heptose 1-phosphate guanylyltransferase
MSEVDGIILAGGQGTRLRAVVSDRPKVLALVKGKPFLCRLLDQLKEAGVRSVVLSTGYMADDVESTIGETYDGIRIRYSREQHPLGTAGAVRLALGETMSDPILVLNGDSFCEVDLEQLCRFHCAKLARATIVLAQVEDTSRFGRVETDSAGAVTSFEEKGAAASAGWINAGVYCLNREVAENIPAAQTRSLELEVFPRLIGTGLFGFKAGREFLDIGTPRSYEEAQSFFEPQR